MSETPGRPRRRWNWLVRGLAALLWIALLGFLWWWLPFPARTNLATPDKLLILGFSADGETLVTMRSAPPEMKTGDDALAAFILRGISPHYSGPIQAWDARTGKERARFAEDWGHITHIGLAPKGDFLAADDGAGILKVWDVQTGQERGVLKSAGLGTYDERHTFWFSPDGRTLAYKAARHMLTLWDTATGTDRATLPGNVASPEVGACIVGLFGAPFPSGHFAAMAKLCTEGTREVWVWSVAFSPDSKTVAIGPLLWPTVTLWDVSTSELKARLAVDGEGSVALAFSSDGSALATGTANQHSGARTELKLWELAAARQRISTQVRDPARESFPSGERPYPKSFTELKLSPDGQLLVARQGDALTILMYTIWNTADLRRPTVAGRNEPAFSPDGRLLAVAEEYDLGGLSLNFATDHPKGRAVRLLEAATLEERVRLEAPGWSSIDSPLFSPDGKFVAASGSYLPFRGLALNELKVWDAEAGREEATLHGYSAPLFSPDGKSLAAINGGSSLGGPVTVWDVPVPARTRRLLGVTALWLLAPLLGYRWYNARKRK